MSNQDPTPAAPVLQGGSRKPGTFLPGDKRINRKGRPKSFAQLRQRVLTFLSEQDDAGSQTRLETILRQLAVDDPKTLLEYGFGKVPSAVSVNANIESKPLKMYAVVSPDEFFDPPPALPDTSTTKGNAI